MYIHAPFWWWLDRPIGQIIFSMGFILVGLVIVNLVLLMIYQIRMLSEKKFRKK